MSTDRLADLVRRLNTQKPRAIGILADLNERFYSVADLDRLVKSVDSAVPIFIGFTDETSLGRPVPEVFGDRVFYSPGLVSRDSYNYGADSVSRRVMVDIDRTPSFFARMATYLRGTTPTRIEELSASRHAYIDWQGPSGTYPLLSAWSFLSSGKPRVDVAGKIVLIGHARRSRITQDYVLTPYSRKIGDTPLLEGAAHSLVTLLEDRGLKRAPGWIIALLTLSVALLTVNLVSIFSPAKGIVFMVLLIAGLWGVGWGALHFGGWWLDLAHPVVMAVAGYYLVVPFRLGMEYRRRWHYQQKTELMSQIERMKSNFLSLISHDLKTPIARIQGNAELLLRENPAEKQRKGLSTIVSTTEEMSDYVESVLDLTRIESASMPLQLVSRDINETVHEVVEEKRFLAAEKGIVIQEDLEPLFSVRYDVRLMRRVIGNLVENAIKYSPEHSIITVASREERGEVCLAISDQGYGIADDELEKIFGKFYRGQSATVSTTKGTGLGLYLVKYFVELHKGVVRLQSRVGTGSTFTVRLPV